MNTMIRRSARDFDGFRRELDRFFDTFNTTSGDANSPSWAPRADIVETNDAYELMLDLPGLSRDALNVQFDDGTLKISGERSVKDEHRDGRFHRVERSYGQFFRSFTLGTDVDPDAIEASFDDGVLHIRVPKTEAKKPRRIDILSSGGSSDAQETRELEESNA
ncbi:MAG: Hsp20/alpha crystallin family protein [Rubricoccaceae bacterium]